MNNLSISSIDDIWPYLAESTKFSLWLSASSAALLKSDGDNYLMEWQNIVNNGKTAAQ